VGEDAKVLSCNPIRRPKVTEEEVTKVRRKYEAEWMKEWNVTAISTCKDESDNFFIGVGFESMDEDTAVPVMVDGVRVEYFITDSSRFNSVRVEEGEIGRCQSEQRSGS